MLSRRQFLLVLVALLSLSASINAQAIKDIDVTFSRAQRLAGDSDTSFLLVEASKLPLSSSAEVTINSTAVASITISNEILNVAEGILFCFLLLMVVIGFLYLSCFCFAKYDKDEGDNVSLISQTKNTSFSTQAPPTLIQEGKIKPCLKPSFSDNGQLTLFELLHENDVVSFY